MSALPRHLFVDISAHGFGHLAQTAPVLNVLRARLPELQLTIRSGLPSEHLKQRVEGPFRHISQASDFGLSMKNALDVNVADSVSRYQAFHAQWDTHLQSYAREIAQIKPDLLLANISYLALAAAREAQVPALAMCSLNWMDIFFPYAPENPGLAHIRAQMLAAYNSAETFLRLSPGMPMPQFKHLQDIGPIAASSNAKPGLLQARLGLPATMRIILVAMGGIPLRLPAIWPSMPGYHWLVPRDAISLRDDMSTLELLDLPFSDILAACDCVISKSGYGIFVEAAACGTPLLYVERPDWPEEPCLVDWLKQHNQTHGISRAQFEQGSFGDTLSALLQQPRAQPIATTGIAMAADFIQARLTG